MALLLFFCMQLDDLELPIWDAEMHSVSATLFTFSICAERVKQQIDTTCSSSYMNHHTQIITHDLSHVNHHTWFITYESSHMNLTSLGYDLHLNSGCCHHGYMEDLTDWFLFVARRKESTMPNMTCLNVWMKAPQSARHALPRRVCIPTPPTPNKSLKRRRLVYVFRSQMSITSISGGGFLAHFVSSRRVPLEAHD